MVKDFQWMNKLDLFNSAHGEKLGLGCDSRKRLTVFLPVGVLQF